LYNNVQRRGIEQLKFPAVGEKFSENLVCKFFFDSHCTSKYAVLDNNVQGRGRETCWCGWRRLDSSPEESHPAVGPLGLRRQNSFAPLLFFDNSHTDRSYATVIPMTRGPIFTEYLVTIL